MPVSLFFPDGTEIKAADGTDALRRLGRIQWSPTEDTAEIKQFLAERAWAWNAHMLNADLPDDEFLTALDASGMVAVIYSATKALPTGYRRRAPGSVAGSTTEPEE